MILALEETKLWLREDSEDPLVLAQIQMIIDAVETYLKNATGAVYDGTNSLAKLYCLVLAADWYENRELIGSRPSEKARFTIESMTAQLQYSRDMTPPSAPVGLTATAGNQLVNLTWNPNTEGDLAGYHVYQGGAKITAALITSLSHQVTGLINGATYTFQVSAVDVSGNESKLSSAVRVNPTA